MSDIISHIHKLGDITEKIRTMRNLFYISILLFSLSGNSQNYKNQGEQEDASTIEFFQNKYESQNFEKFKGLMIEINETKIKYDDMILEIEISNQDLKTIFTKGIFYPQIFTENAKAEELVGNGNFRISSFEELKFLNTNVKSKRFRFWLFTKGMSNPKVFFIELTNPNATIDTDLKTFVNNSKLTFAKSGWMIL